jgi:large subunit ribosomal protein L31e
MSSNDFEERVVTVPLRAVKQKPGPKKANVAMREVRDHLAQHFSVDSDAVRLDPSINEAVWAGGRESPPSKLRVRAARFEEDGEGVVEAEIAE